MYNADVARILRLLESLLVLRKMRLAELARHLGITAGNLRRILDGRIELKYRLLLDILTYLDIAPLAFFQIVYESQDATADHQAASLERLRPVEEQTVETMSKDELRAFVLEAVEQLGVLEMLDRLPPDEDGGET